MSRNRPPKSYLPQMLRIVAIQHVGDPRTIYARIPEYRARFKPYGWVVVQTYRMPLARLHLGWGQVLNHYFNWKEGQA